jgi:hypothetical protein
LSQPPDLPEPSTPPAPAASQKWPWRRLSLAHLATFLVIWGGFTLLVWWATSEGLSDKSYVPQATLATILGPLTGAISRDGQGCCLEFSLWLLPFALCGPILATAVQFAPAPRHVAIDLARLTVWSIGWVVWFGSGIVSLGHALS